MAKRYSITFRWFKEHCTSHYFYGGKSRCLKVLKNYATGFCRAKDCPALKGKEIRDERHKR